MKSNKKSLEQFYEAHIDKVYRYFYMRCLNKSVAEDLTSECFIALAEQMDKETAMEDKTKYLYGIMRNRWNSYLREKYNLKVVYTDSIENIALAVEEDAREWSGQSLEQRVLKYIEKLPKKQREIAYQRLILKHTNNEIAAALGTDTNYVKVTFRRSLRSLERIIENSDNEVKR